jgi:hypothetical protein
MRLVRRPVPLRPLAFVLGLGLFVGGGCFSLDEPPCSFSCGPGGACPDDYVCMADNYCHKSGSPGMCPYPDAAVATDMTAPLPGDMASAPKIDQSPGPADGGGSSDAEPDL